MIFVALMGVLMLTIGMALTGYSLALGHGWVGFLSGISAFCGAVILGLATEPRP